MSSKNPIIQRPTSYRTSNARFSPTPTKGGTIHLGHVWVMLLNREAAHSVGGRFIVRFEDVLGVEMDRSVSPSFLRARCDVMLEEMERMDLMPDLVVWQSEEMPIFRSLTIGGESPEAVGVGDTRMTIIEGAGDRTATSREVGSTAYRVFSDVLHTCDPIIRGHDLLIEDWLYDDTCRRMGVVAPQRIYVPKLSLGDDVMSKSAGTGSVDRLLNAGHSPEQLIEAILRAAAKDPSAGFNMSNVAPQPKPIVLK